MGKICKHCSIEKDESEYNKTGGGKWLQPYCKPCDVIRKKEYYIKNKEKIKKKCKNYYLNNKESIIQKTKQYSANNRELVLNGKKNYYYKNKEKISEKVKNSTEEQKIKNRQRVKKYRFENKELLNKKAVLRSKNDIEFRLLKTLRSRIRFALKSKNSDKLHSASNLLGCSISFFKNYLEERFLDGMSWDNYGLKGWHIDHKIPCILFDLIKEEEQKLCFHYKNLQPLWAIDNLKKGISLNYKSL